MEKTPFAFEKGGFCAGFNKTVKTVKSGRAAMVWAASDADALHRNELIRLCETAEVPWEDSLTKKQLGKLCGLEVDCAAAAVFKKDKSGV